jgi:hypothetical protein
MNKPNGNDSSINRHYVGGFFFGHKSTLRCNIAFVITALKGKDIGWDLLNLIARFFLFT